MFPLADARGRVIGFQARKLHDDDPLKGKYVNSPESELFKKSSVLYGLHLARPAVAKQDRAVVVEGNTDVIALRQAGFEPVVAAMGTALTEQHLRELARLTKRSTSASTPTLPARRRRCAGWSARTRRASRSRSSCCPRGRIRPTRRRASRTGWVTPRATPLPRSAGDRARVRPAGGVRPCPRGARRGRGFTGAPGCAPSPRRPARPAARDAVGDRAGTGRGGGRDAQQPRKLLDAGIRLEREALAAVVAHPDLVDALAGLGEEHFDLDEHRRMRPSLVARTPPEPDLVGLLAELDATAASEGITKRAGTEMLLRLRERKLRRDLQGESDLARATELQAHLAKVRQALTELA